MVGVVLAGATSEAVGEVGTDEGWDNGEGEEDWEAGRGVAEEGDGAEHEPGPTGDGSEPPSIGEQETEGRAGGEVEGGGDGEAGGAGIGEKHPAPEGADGGGEDGEEEIAGEGHRRELSRRELSEQRTGDGSDLAEARRWRRVASA